MILHSVSAGPANAPPVVLLHGLFGAGRNLGSVARRLARTRQVWSLDLRNHGASPHAPDMDYRTQAADVSDTLDSLGLGRASLVGHSMGGKVAMTLALHQPGRVERLVVADIAPAPYRPHFRAHADAMLAIPPEASRTDADALLATVVPEPELRGFLLSNRSPGPGWRIGLREIADALPAIEGWPNPEGRHFDGPVLAIRGGRSFYVRPEHEPALAALFPDLRLQTLPQAGHWLHVDDPDGFASALDTFLPGLGPAGEPSPGA